MSHLFPQQNNAPGYSPAPYGNPEPLAFFGGASSSSSTPYYPGSRPSLEGTMGGGGYASGSMPSGRMGMGATSMGMMSEGKWWEAFGTGGFEGEPSLMEGGSTRGGAAAMKRPGNKG
jgi:hypothetical protein